MENALARKILYQPSWRLDEHIDVTMDVSQNALLRVDDMTLKVVNKLMECYTFDLLHKFSVMCCNVVDLLHKFSVMCCNVVDLLHKFSVMWWICHISLV
jgi:hypothetical protein